MVIRQIESIGVLFFGIFLAIVFYILPAHFADLLFTPTQLAESVDQSFYLYYAREFCSNKPDQISDYEVTWSSIGVVLWLTNACSITGSIYGFLLFNSVLFVLSLTYLIKSFEEDSSSRPRSISVFWVPFALLHIYMPGKEIFSASSCLLAVGFAIRIIRNRANVLAFAVLCLAIFIATFSRPHEGVILVICVAASIASYKYGFSKVVMLLVLGVIIVDNFLFEPIIHGLGFTTISSLYDQVATKGEYDKYLSNENLFIHLALSPIRIIVYSMGFLLGPVLNLITSEFRGYAYFIFKDVALMFRLMDGVILCVFLWFGCKKNIPPAYRVAVNFILYYLFFVTLAGIDQKTRYATAILPIAALMVLNRGSMQKLMLKHRRANK